MKEIKTMNMETMADYADMFGEGAAKAIIRYCKKRKMSLESFLFEFIMHYVDDEFFDYLYELCEKYHIKMYDDEECDF